MAYTNRVPVSRPPGAGRPHGVLAMGTMIRPPRPRELGLEPAEVRWCNPVPQPDEFPWDVGLTFQDGGPTLI